MATTQQVRHRRVGACVIGLLCLSSVLMTLVSDSSTAYRIFVAVSALAIAGGFITYLMRGREKGAQLIFAPVRWHFWLVSIMGGVAIILIVWSLLGDPKDRATAAYVPAMVAAWVGAMFRSEAVVEKERAFNQR